MTRLPPAPFAYALTDSELGEAGHGALAGELIAAGIPVIQVRDKRLGDGALLVQVREAVERARPAGTLVIVNDRLDVALLAGAGGVHLGEDDLPAGLARRLGGPELRIGVSSHGIEAALAAAGGPVDYVALGPIYPSSTKPGRPALGPDAVWQVRRRTDRPLVAIGGITPVRVRELVQAGASGIAVVSAVMVPGRVEARARDLVAAVCTAGAAAR